MADDEFYISVFETEFDEIDFSTLHGAETAEQKAQNLQIMIDFLGNSVYEIDLSHIEATEILQGNYDHINRFIKLLYEWTLFQTGNINTMCKKPTDLGNSDCMPTVDTYGNINNRTQNKTNIIDYSKARPELNIAGNSQTTSKFRILSNNEVCENNEINEIFKNTVGDNISSRTPSLATSVNTTVLGPNGKSLFS